jgi:histone H3/H4
MPEERHGFTGRFQEKERFAMAAKSKAARTTKSSRKGKDVLVVASKVKSYMHGKKMNASADAIARLSERVYGMLDLACDRSKANGRKTIKPQDI